MLEWIQHLGGEFAGLADDGADCVLVDTFQDVAGCEVVEVRRGLERVHDVVYWSLIGHGTSRLCRFHP